MTAAGSPGPLLRNTPSGFCARTSLADVNAGHDVNVAAVTGKQSKYVLLDAEIIRDHFVFQFGLCRSRASERQSTGLSHL